MTTSTRFGRLLWAGLLIPGCALLGVEPDEIDVANEETSSGVSTASNGDSETGSDANDAQGDGDGDPGDGDGDTGDGDGDPSTSGDGDGDSTGDGDGDTGDGDPGDGDGDGDGDGVPCAMYQPIVVLEADNAIDIPDGMSTFEGSCGSPGPDAVFSFTATSDASYEFTLSSDAFDGVLYLVAGVCDPLAEIACELENQAIVEDMLSGEVVYIIVDSDVGFGAATLSIAAI